MEKKTSIEAFNLKKKKAEKKFVYSFMFIGIGVIILLSIYSQASLANFMFLPFLFFITGAIFIGIGGFEFNKVKKEFKFSFLTKVFEELIPGIEYSPSLGLDQYTVYSTEFLKKADSLRTAITLAKSDPESEVDKENEVKDLVHDIDETIKEETKSEEIEQEPTPSKPVTKVKPKTSFMDFIRNIKPVYWIIFFVVVLVFVLSLIIYANPEKSKKKVKEKPSYRNEEGFGTEDFRINMIASMKKSGWGETEIAKELMISLEEVRSLSKKIKE